MIIKDLLTSSWAALYNDDCIAERWVAQWLEHTVTGLATKGSWVQILAEPLRNFVAIPFTQLCRCLSEETLKAVGPFYLVSQSMPGEVKYPITHHIGEYVTCRGIHNPDMYEISVSHKM